METGIKGIDPRLQQLDNYRQIYAEQWGAHAVAHESDGDYAWLAEDIKGYAKVLEIGCGVGHSTRELLKQGHAVVSVEENPHCIDATKRLLEQSGYSVRLMLRSAVLVSGEALDFTYDANYSDCGDIALADCVIVEGDALEDPKLVRWLKRIDRFDAVVCWLMGAHQFGNRSVAAYAREISTAWQYRVLVQNSVYELADEILRPQGILNVADRSEAPSSDFVREAIFAHHREQASVTSLRVDRLRHKSYDLMSVEGGLQMQLVSPTDGSTADRTITHSLNAVTSTKP